MEIRRVYLWPDGGIEAFDMAGVDPVPEYSGDAREVAEKVLGCDKAVFYRASWGIRPWEVSRESFKRELEYYLGEP